MRKGCVQLFLFFLFIMLINIQLSAKDYLSNQSPEYHRTFSRNASIDSADIANYNPAGTVFLADGFYVNVGNQTIYRKLNSIEYNGKEYETTVPVPILPATFVVYKKGNIAFFGGGYKPGG